MHTSQGTITLTTPEYRSSITLLVRGESEQLTALILELSLRAVRFAVEPLQESSASQQ